MKKRVLLLGGDRQFASEMVAAAEALGIELSFFPSVIEMGSIGGLGQYELIISNEQLQNLSGQEIATYVDTFFSDIPVVLIEPPQRVPTLERLASKSIRGRIDNSGSAASVLKQALSIGTKPADPTLPQ